MIRMESMSPHTELVCFQSMRAYVVEENDMTQCHSCHVIPRAKTLVYIVLLETGGAEASTGNTLKNEPKCQQTKHGHETKKNTKIQNTIEPREEINERK